MAIPLVETKFFRSTLQAAAVARPSLVDRLSGDSRVVLRSAPAGPPMTALLKTMRRQDPGSAYLRRLLDAATGPHRQPDEAAASGRRGARPRGHRDGPAAEPGRRDARPSQPH